MTWGLWNPGLVADSSQSSYWEAQSWITGTDRQYFSADLVGCSRQSFIWTRTVATGAREDVAVWHLDWGVNTGGVSGSVPLSGTQMASIEGITDTLWTSLKPNISTEWTLARYEWREWKASHPLGKTGIAKFDPVSRTTIKNQPGTAAGQRLPDQSALTITLETASRRHWGRSYLGGFTTAKMAAFGHTSTADCDNISGYFRTAFNSAAALPAITNPVVLSAKYRGILAIRLLQMDDVWDVIRRRRAKTATYRKQYTS